MSTNSNGNEKRMEVDSPQCTLIVHQRWRQLWILLLAILLRIFSAHFLFEFFMQNPQFSTPWSSFKRFREGVFLYKQQNSTGNVYDGDIFHVLPIFLRLLEPTVNSAVLLQNLWLIFDLLTASYIQRFVSEYIKIRCLAQISDPQAAKQRIEESQWLNVLAYGGYLLNPMTIGCWTVLSLCSPINLLVAISFCNCCEGHLISSILPLCLAIQLNPYYLILFTPIFIRFKGVRLFAILFTIFSSFAIFSSNFLFLNGDKNALFDMFWSTTGFFLSVPDLTPNTGIFWYFFTQVFEHYRLLFLCAFQLNTLLYAVPLSALLRKNTALLNVHLLLIVALFSPYPSYAEAALYLATIAAFFDLHKYLRQRLVMGCALMANFALSPIMWSMWVIAGSGNANFFFAIVCVFNLTQVFIAADLLSAYLREQIITANGGDREIEQRFEGLRLIGISPF